MLDASNPDQAKVKKNKPQNRPLQRFWPDNIANLRPQMPSSHEGDLSENSSPLSPGGCSGGGGASNDSTSIVTSSQPSTQHLVVLSMAPTATTSTASKQPLQFLPFLCFIDNVKDVVRECFYLMSLLGF